MRVLVAIAHHGTKNRAYLLRMLDAFDRMEHDVHVVILCEEPKDLPAHVEQIVGLPSADPWSLPFAHRPIFAERAAEYDLFVYSEDDTFIEQRHLDTFVELQHHLPEDVITGFMRYEEYPDGTRSYCTVHSHYRWLPGSPHRIKRLTYARFTNDHAACYALTRDQLHRAIRSGGFAVEPHAGRYDMLVSAATDVYTQCGMTKYMCLDRMEDQLVHHMPNVYLGKLGVTEASMASQVDALRELADAGAPRELLSPETVTPDAVWDRHSFPNTSAALVAAFEERPRRRVLNVGGTTGDLELALRDLGHELVSVPQDTVFGRVLHDRGIEVLQPTSLRPATQFERFDYVLLLDVLPYLEDPVGLLSDLHHRAADGARMVATVPDHARYRARNCLPRTKKVAIPDGFGTSGIHRTHGRVIQTWLRAAGWEPELVNHRAATRREPVGRGGLAASLSGNTVLAVATPSR